MPDKFLFADYVNKPRLNSNISPAMHQEYKESLEVPLCAGREHAHIDILYESSNLTRTECL